MVVRLVFVITAKGSGADAEFGVVVEDVEGAAAIILWPSLGAKENMKDMEREWKKKKR